MATAAQNRALGKGLAAAVQRSGERTTTWVKIQHAPQIPQYQVLKDVRHGLRGLNAAHTTIELDEEREDLKAALAKEKTENKMLRRHIAAMTAKMQAAPASAERWVSVRDAAEILGVHKQTIYRAIDDGRIVKESTRVTRKRNHKVDPTTYKQKERQPRKPRSKKTKQ